MSKPINIASIRILANSDANVFAKAITGYGLKVIGVHNQDPLETRVQKESIEAMSSIIMEDIDDGIELTRAQKTICQIAEDHGFIVRPIT